MRAKGTATTVLTSVSLLVVRADTRAAAILAVTATFPVRAEASATTLPTFGFLSIMDAEGTASTLLAPVFSFPVLAKCFFRSRLANGLLHFQSRVISRRLRNYHHAQ